MGRQIEFLVKGIVEGISERFHVIGRNCGDAIRVGDLLESTFRYHDDPSTSNGVAHRVDVKQVSLRVERIQAYGHELKELGAGMTGSLDLAGVGVDAVTAGHLLGTAADPTNADSQVPRDVSKPSAST